MRTQPAVVTRCSTRSSESVSETDILEAESAILAANRDRFLELQRH